MVNNKNVAHTFQIEDHGWSLINLLLCTSICICLFHVQLMGNFMVQKARYKTHFIYYEVYWFKRFSFLRNLKKKFLSTYYPI